VEHNKDSMDPDTIARLRALREAKLRKETETSSVTKQQQPPRVPENNVAQSVPSPLLSAADGTQRKSRWDSVAPVPTVSALVPPPQPSAIHHSASPAVSVTINANTSSTSLPPSHISSSIVSKQTSSLEAASLGSLGPAGQARVQRIEQGMNDDEPPRRAFAGRKRDDSTNGYLDPELFLSGASSERPLDASSCPRGYRLLLKMGWSEGTGLGKTSEGMVAPLATTVAANDTKLGIGKGNEYNEKLDLTAAESGDKRRRLEEGDASSALLRAHHEAKMEAIAVEKKEELKPFFCDWCQKQYASVSEWEVHLQSYGHTHTRNMKELRLSEGARRAALGGSKEEKLEKEAKRAERELAKRMKAAGVPTLKPSTTVPVPNAATSLMAAETQLSTARALEDSAVAVALSGSSQTPGSASDAQLPVVDAASTSNSGGWDAVDIDVDGEVSSGRDGGGWGFVSDSADMDNVEAPASSRWDVTEEAVAKPTTTVDSGVNLAEIRTAVPSAASTKAPPAVKFGFSFKKR